MEINYTDPYNTISDLDTLTVVEKLKNMLISHATGGLANNDEYRLIRKRLMSDKSIDSIVPIFIKTCTNLDEFWAFIKSKFNTYAERRQYLYNELNNIIVYLEQSDETQLINSEFYEIGERIGNGGFGEVFKYYNKLIGINFAVKILNPSFIPENEKNQYCERFFREAKIMFKLDHPNIIKIYDVGMMGTKPFIRMEYIEGYNIYQILDKYSTMSFNQCIEPIIAILEGLNHAHINGILHRDLKPSNVMRSKNNQYKIIDFGMGAYIEFELYSRLTRTGEKIVGGHFTDPELEKNPTLKDVRSDIYSVGSLWYYLLTGRVPAGDGLKANLIKNYKLIEFQAEIIMKCMKQNINERFKNCSEVLKAINDNIA